MLPKSLIIFTHFRRVFLKTDLYIKIVLIVKDTICINSQRYFLVLMGVSKQHQ